ncbi:MAG: hypothetical protein RR494_03325 [Vagococcus sp.]|uniref:hypothetical protein n=1 Tax=Vagococcus TaxID=2737 RepID=UPI002FC5C460
MKKKILIISGILIFTIITISLFSPFKKSLQTDTLKITGKFKDEKTAKELLACLEKNINAANNKDMDTYLETLTPEKREDTKKEMTSFFKEYDIQTELLTFDIKKQDDDHALVQAQQKSINHGDNKYRNHIAEANHTFVKIDGNWYIDQSVMSNTKFIKK